MHRRAPSSTSTAALLLSGVLAGLGLSSCSESSHDVAAAPITPKLLDATCGRVSDVPMPLFEAPPTEPDFTPLKRVHDLLESFSKGEGEYRSRKLEGRGAMLWVHKLHEGILLRPLPWRVVEPRREAAKFIAWNPVPEEPLSLQNESTLGIVMQDGDAWCTPPLDLVSGARLRLEPLGLERATVRLRLEWESDGRAERILETTARRPGALSADTQVDVPLSKGHGRVCFEARGGILGLGEPRVLTPERESEDSRPRWIVLLVLDALRADAVDRDEAKRISPALFDLTRTGRYYADAFSNGCHTRAAVWPLMMGRDLMRIDPLKRRETIPIQGTFSSVYARGNLFVTHLAENAGYHSVFLGNNEYFSLVPAFSRFSSHGKLAWGTYDTVTRLPALMERYRDERVMLVYYVSNPHSRSATPSRLVEEFGCAELEGFEQCRCAYDARVRHADESVTALQQALAHYGLDEETLQVVTSDHGEVLEDGIPLEKRLALGNAPGSYWRPMDYGHGETCHWRELKVPLIFHGPGIEPGRVEDRVSTLDVVPTLAAMVDLPVTSLLDGRVLPTETSATNDSANRRFVSYGFCSESSLLGSKQLIWWTQGCHVRDRSTKKFLDYRSELWVDGRRVETDRTDPKRLEREMVAHENYLEERVLTDVWLLDVSGLPPGRLTVRTETGRISDFGPSETIYGLAALESSRLDESGRTLTVDYDGFEGLFFVATRPPNTPVTVELLTSDGSVPVTFSGALQLPVEVLGRRLDPEKSGAVLSASSTPPRRATPEAQMRLWWDPFLASEGHGDRKSFTEFERILRDWGYIR